MLIDFTKMKDLIPEKGSVTFTIKHAKDGKLSVLYSSKHSITAVNSSYDKSIEGDKKAVAEASQALNKIMPFKDTPEELTAKFDESITKTYTAEKKLVAVINERVDDINERIKELKSKNSGKNTATKKPDTKSSTETAPKKGTISLFDTTGSGSPNDTSSSKIEEEALEEKAGEDETGADETADEHMEAA